jgi:site-specific recombinase XerD
MRPDAISGFPRIVSCDAFRHSFAAHLLAEEYDVRTIQGLLGRKDVTTMLYADVVD